MKRESHAMLAHQTKQVLFLLPKIGTQNETLDSDIEEGCQAPNAFIPQPPDIRFDSILLVLGHKDICSFCVTHLLSFRICFNFFQFDT